MDNGNDYEKEIAEKFPETPSEWPENINSQGGARWFRDTIHAGVVKEKDEKIMILETNLIDLDARGEGYTEKLTKQLTEIEQLKKKLDDVQYIVARVVYKNLVGLYQGDGMSIPCKNRTDVENKIVAEIIASLNPKD